MFIVLLSNHFYYIHSDSKEEKGDGRPAWMKTLNTTSTEWLSLLPTVR